MFRRPRENVKVERGSTFTFTRDLSYNAVAILFTHVKPVKVYVLTHTYVKITRQWKSTFKDSKVSAVLVCSSLQKPKSKFAVALKAVH